MELIDFAEPQPYVKDVLRYLPNGGEVLDLGTGNGRNAMFFAKRGFAVTALDSDEAKIGALRRVCARERVSMQFVQEDVRSWRSDRCYIAILCAMVLHFLSSEDEVAAVIGEMRAATRTGGVNVVSIYTSRNQVGTRPFLMAPHRLKTFYPGWTELEAYEGLGRCYRIDDLKRPARDFVERVTVRKPPRRDDASASESQSIVPSQFHI